MKVFKIIMDMATHISTEPKRGHDSKWLIFRTYMFSLYRTHFINMLIDLNLVKISKL